MPSKQLLLYFAVGLGVVALLVGGFLFWTRGAHIELRGKIQKVRLQEMDERSAVAVIDFRFTNPSDHPFIVREATVVLVDDKGQEFDGRTIADTDVKRLFEYYPMLGQRFNETLKLRDKVPPHASMDRMVTARFEGPVGLLEKRRKIKLRITDVDGAVSEVSE